jgi:hypothetical protein
VVNGLFYLAFGIIGPHVRRDLLPSAAELSGIPHSMQEMRHEGSTSRKTGSIFRPITLRHILFPKATPTGQRSERHATSRQPDSYQLLLQSRHTLARQ